MARQNFSTFAGLEVSGTFYPAVRSNGEDGCRVRTFGARRGRSIMSAATFIARCSKWETVRVRWTDGTRTEVLNAGLRRRSLLPTMRLLLSLDEYRLLLLFRAVPS